MKNNNVEALTKERKGCNGMHLIIGDRQTKLGEPDLFLTADSLKRSEYDALSVVCASYMRLNDDLNRLIKTYREQLEEKDGCFRSSSLVCIIREQEETINVLRKQLRFIINSVLSDGCLNCALNFVKSGNK